MKKTAGKYNKRNTKQNITKASNRGYGSNSINASYSRSSMRYVSNADIRNSIYSRYGGVPSGTSRSTNGYGTYMSAGSAYANSRSRAASRSNTASTIRYNMGSVAYDTAYVADTDVFTNTPKGKSKNKTVAKRAREVAPLSLLKTLFTVVMCTFFILSIVMFIASNSSSKEQLSDVKQQLAQLKEDNAELKNDIEEKIDLAQIEKEALKLGLQKPSAYQIVKINVPKESYTVQYGTEEIDEDSVGLKEVLEDFGKTVQKKLDKILRVD